MRPLLGLAWAASLLQSQLSSVKERISMIEGVYGAELQSHAGALAALRSAVESGIAQRLENAEAESYLNGVRLADVERSLEGRLPRVEALAEATGGRLQLFESKGEDELRALHLVIARLEDRLSNAECQVKMDKEERSSLEERMANSFGTMAADLRDSQAKLFAGLNTLFTNYQNLQAAQQCSELEIENVRELVTKSEVVLSDLSRDIGRDINAVRNDTQITARRLVNEFNESLEQQRKGLENLKVAFEKIVPPRILGGFRPAEVIHLSVPGFAPLTEGMIAHLTKRCGGHVQDRQCVHIFSDSVHGASHAPRNVADFATDASFVSADHPNQSIGYDFKENQRIAPTHYVVRSVPAWPVKSHHLRSWVIEVSKDRSNENSWVEIDRRESNQDLNGPGILQLFAISYPPDEEFRCIRLRQTGVNHARSNILGVSAFEVFGQLRMRIAALM
jgi:hypothetical protein